MRLDELSVNFLINMLAGIAGILIVLWIERQRRAKLTFSVPQIQEMSEDKMGRPDAKWLHVNICNKPMPKWFRWIGDREPAYACQAQVTFHRVDGSLLYNREMAGRWNSLPEPELVYSPGKDGTTYIAMRNYFYPMDIPAASNETLAIAIRIRDEDQCYGFCNESYLYQDPEDKWRCPDWMLDKGVYLTKVRVKTSGREFTDAFRIVNDVRYEDFRLEPLEDRRLRRTLGLK